MEDFVFDKLRYAVVFVAVASLVSSGVLAFFGGRVSVSVVFGVLAVALGYFHRRATNGLIRLFCFRAVFGFSPYFVRFKDIRWQFLRNCVLDVLEARAKELDKAYKTQRLLDAKISSLGGINQLDGSRMPTSLFLSPSEKKALGKEIKKNDRDLKRLRARFHWARDVALAARYPAPTFKELVV